MNPIPELEVVRSAPMVVRAAADDAGMPVMEVRFSPFDVWYEIDSYWEGRFLERTVRGAFAKTIQENRDRVKALFNHGYDPQIGDKVLGTIEDLREDADTAVGDVQLFDTTYVRELLPGIQAGVYGSSMRMRVIKDEWNEDPGVSEHNPQGIPERTILEVRLYEFGPVTFPANGDATSGVRSDTDDFYERLRAHDPQHVTELEVVRNSRTLPGRAAGSTTAPEAGAAENPTIQEPAARHSGGLTFAQRGRLITINVREHRNGESTVDAEITELRGRIEKIDEERRSIHETAGEAALTDEQQTRWDELDTEETEARKELAAAEERAARAQRVAESRARWGSLQVGEKVSNDDVDVRSLSTREARDRALKRADSASEGIEIRDEQRAKLDRLLRATSDSTDGSQIARRLLLTENDAYRSAFVKAVTSVTPAWTPEEARAIAAFAEFERAMSIGSTTSGGFGVPVLIDPTIILTGQESLNPFRRISRVETITTNKWKGVSSAGVSWSYDAEAAEVSDDSPTLAQPEVPVHMARGFIPYSIEIGQDYPGFANEMSVLLVEGYDELQAQKFAVGSGTGEPKGIVTALDADTNVEVVVTTDGALGAVDITKVWKALPDRAKGNATWVMGAGTASDIAAFGDAYGTRTSDLTGNLERLRQRPVEASSYIPDFAGATTAQNLLVVGDFRKYLIAERAGMSVELIPHLFGTTNNRPTGQRGWFAYARSGADVIDIRAFRLLQNQ